MLRKRNLAVETKLSTVSAVAGNAVGKNYAFKSLRQKKSLPRIKWANGKQRRRKHYVDYVDVLRWGDVPLPANYSVWWSVEGLYDIGLLQLGGAVALW